jgi:hypothetical protein
MLAVCSGIKSVVLINCLPPGQSFNGPYFSQKIAILLAAMLQARGQANGIP